MAKYVHIKGLERQQLRNYSRSLQLKIRNLIKGQEVVLSEDEAKDLGSYVKRVNETVVNKKAKSKGVDYGVK